MRVRLFKKTKDNLSYFQFLTDDEVVVLNSQGYDGKANRNKGVRSVVANAGNPDQYEILTVGGKHFFTIKAGNGEEIARSVEYDEKQEMEAAKATCIAEIPAIPSNEEQAAETDTDPATRKAEKAPADTNPYRGNADGDDNYKPLAFYQERIQGVENGFDSFASEDGTNFYFTLNRSGRIVLISESYTSQSGRNNGVESVMKNLPLAERYQRKIHANGSHYFNLLAGNNQAIATSVWFGSDGEMNETILALQQGFFGTATTGELEAMEAGYRASVAIVEAPVERRDVEEKPRKKRKKREKKESAGEKVYLKSGGYLFNEVTYQTMRSANGKYYFSFRDADGKSILLNANVRGFDTEEEVDAAVQRILEFGPTEANYLGKTTRNGKYYFYLRDAEGKNIGKSFFFDTAEEMQEAIGLLIGQARGVVAPPQGLGTADAVRDDYLPCDRYAGGAGFHLFFNAMGEEWYFAFNGDNGKTYLRSEGYTTESARDNGVASVIKNAPLEERWKMVEEDGKYYYSLRAGNHQEIARSCPYDDAASRDAAWAWITGEESIIGFGSTERDGVRFSAGMIRREAAAAERQRREAEAAAKAAEEEAKIRAAAEAKRKADAEAAVAAKAAELAAKRKEEEAAAKRKDDDYLACKEYEAHAAATSDANPDFATFQQDGEYYFAWVEDGTVLMRSEGYTTEKARDNGIESVKKNRDMEVRFSIEEKMNHFFVVLKAGNHQEIARSCPYKDRAAALALFPSAREKARAAKMVAAAPPKPAHQDDDYLACKEYLAHINDVSEKYPGFITFEKEGQHYFAWVEKGEIVLRSEGYTTESARNNGIESVMKNREIQERFSVEEKMGHYFLVLKAGNHQEIGRGCPQKEKSGAMAWFPAGTAAKLAAAATLLVPGPTPEEKEDDYLPCSAYEGHEVSDAANNLALFEHDGQYYFVIYNKDGSVRLRSEGFETIANRNDELAAALKYLDHKKMYTTMTWGKYRLHILKDENGREVGRSCLERVPMAAIPPVLPEKEDDYLKCEEYEGRKVNDKENNVALFKHENGQFYFAVYDDEGKVRIRSEGFRDAKERDVELSAVLKNIDNKDRYEEIRKGKYHILVLKDETGREVGRTCLQERAAGAVFPPVGAAAAATAGAIAATAGTAGAAAGAGTTAAGAAAAGAAASSKTKVTAPVPPLTPLPVVEKSGGFNWWWLLPILLALGLAWWLMNTNGCAGCGSASISDNTKIETPAGDLPGAKNETPSAGGEDTGTSDGQGSEGTSSGETTNEGSSSGGTTGNGADGTDGKAVVPPAVTKACDCGAFSSGMFAGIATRDVKSLRKLGTYPEFGNSHSLDATGFYNKLKDRYAISRTDKLFLDRLFKQMGYANGFADATAGMFSSVTVDRGTIGYMGFGKGHQTVYASLDVVLDDDTKAFRIEAANGCTMHFMKTCGNHFFFCPK